MKDLDLVHCNTVQYTLEAWRCINTNEIGTTDTVRDSLNSINS